MLDEAPPLVLARRWPPRSWPSCAPGERARSQGELSPAEVARFPGVIESLDLRRTLTAERGTELVGLLDRALDSWTGMRRAEGEHLRADLERSLREISAGTERLADLAQTAKEAARPGWRRSAGAGRRAGARRGPLVPGGGAAGGARRRQRGAGAAAQPSRPGRGDAGAGGAVRQAARFPGQELLREPTPSAQGRQRGHGPGGGGPQGGDRAFASRYRTLSDRVPSLIVVSAPVRGREEHHPGTRPGRPARPALLGLAHDSQPRPQERDGVHYHFVTRPASRRWSRRTASWSGQRFTAAYGTGRREYLSAVEEGYDLVLDIDVQGARQVRARQPGGGERLHHAAVVFRSSSGACATAEWMTLLSSERRLAAARAEIAAHVEYDYLVVNEKVEQSVADLTAINRAARLGRWSWFRALAGCSSHSRRGDACVAPARREQKGLEEKQRVELFLLLSYAARPPPDPRTTFRALILTILRSPASAMTARLSASLPVLLFSSRGATHASPYESDWSTRRARGPPDQRRSRAGLYDGGQVRHALFHLLVDHQVVVLHVSGDLRRARPACARGQKRHPSAVAQARSSSRKRRRHDEDAHAAGCRARTARALHVDVQDQVVPFFHGA